MREISNIYYNKTVFRLYGKIERFQGEWEKLLSLNPRYLQERKNTALTRAALASVHINGGELNEETLHRYVREGFKLPDDAEKSVRDGVAYYKTLQYLLKRYKYLDVTEETICHLHRKLTVNFPPDTLSEELRGKYKQEANDVVTKNRETGETVVLIKATEPGEETEEAMRNLLSEYHELIESDDVPPLVICAGFIISFLSILPFKTSNSELSRILTHFLLLKAGYGFLQYYPHEEGVKLLKENYFLSLRKTHVTLLNKEPNYLPWLEFFLSSLYAVMELPQKREGAGKDKTLIARMNRNERKVYHLVEEYKLCSPAFIREYITMSRDGLKTLLVRMVSHGYLVRSGKGKGSKYSIADQSETDDIET